MGFMIGWTLGCLKSSKAFREGLVVISSLLLCYFLFFTHQNVHEVGIARNAFTGVIHIQGPGSYLTAPWVRVASIDTRPHKVCVTSSAKMQNCKLARFVPEQYELFVKTQGFYYYWWANRISFNFGYPDEYRGIVDLIRGYAYDDVHYPFIEEVK